MVCQCVSQSICSTTRDLNLWMAVGGRPATSQVLRSGYLGTVIVEQDRNPLDHILEDKKYGLMIRGCPSLHNSLFSLPKCVGPKCYIAGAGATTEIHFMLSNTTVLGALGAIQVHKNSTEVLGSLFGRQFRVSNGWFLPAFRLRINSQLVFSMGQGPRASDVDPHSSNQTHILPITIDSWTNALQHHDRKPTHSRHVCKPGHSHNHKPAAPPLALNTLAPAFSAFTVGTRNAARKQSQILHPHLMGPSPRPHPSPGPVTTTQSP